jgi:hypothetical protein
MKLVEDAKNFKGWISMQAMGANTAFLLTWSILPAKFQDAIPTPWVIGIAVAFLVIGMIGRVAKQEPKS